MDDRTGQEPKSEYFAKLSKGNSNKRACAIAWSYSVFDRSEPAASLATLVAEVRRVSRWL